MRKQNKKAVSELITTVLIVGLAIVAFGVVYSYLVPMIRGGIESSKLCSNTQLSINTASGFTYYEGKVANVMISRGAKGDANDLAGIQIKVTDDKGNSKTQEFLTGLPDINGDKTFQVTLEATAGAPYSAAVAAIVKLGNKNIYCDLSPETYLEAKAAA